METLAACPLCAGRRWSRITDRGLDLEGEVIRACHGCGLFFQSPRMDAGELAAYYPSEYSARYRGAERPDAAALAYRDAIARYRFELLAGRGVLTPGATLLEAGCGAGNFLGLCRDHGLEVWGVEPSGGYAEAAVAAGLRVTVGGLPDQHGELDRYDLVALFHVLEHLSDPPAILRRLGRLLAPGGALLLEVPDLERALARPSFSERYFHRPHLFDFTAASLRRLLAAAGFRVELEDYCTAQPRRRHHLLVVARRTGETAAAPPAGDPAIERLIRRVRRRLWIAGRLAPPLRRLRRLAGGRG